MENFAAKRGSKASSMTSTARILIIAGSDSGGGAGIQADIKTVTMLGGHAMTAVTAITAQNTLGVTAVHPIPTETILAQIDAIARALIETDNMTSWQGQRIDTTSTHGTGCTLASGIAFFLATGCSLADSVARAREFVRIALHEAPGLGAGGGPIGQASVRLDVGAGPRLNQVT